MQREAGTVVGVWLDSKRHMSGMKGLLWVTWQQGTLGEMVLCSQMKLQLPWDLGVLPSSAAQVSCA